MYLEAIRKQDKNEKYNLLLQMKNYVLNKMGGFNIDGWKINSSI